MRQVPGERFQTMGEVREALRVDSDLLAETVIVAPKRRAVSGWWRAWVGWGLRTRTAVIVPAPVARVALDKPRPTEAAPAPEVAARVRLVMRTEIDRDAQAGMALEFTVTDAVTVGGQLCWRGWTKRRSGRWFVC